MLALKHTLTLLALVTPVLSFANFMQIPQASQNSVAINVCQTLQFDSYKSECLGIVMNGVISNSAATLCSYISNDYNKLACLKSTVNKQYNLAALDSCSVLTNESYKLTCLEKIADKNFQQKNLNQCSRVTNEYYRLDCLDAVANRVISDTALAVCSSIDNEYSRIQCFRENAQPWIPETVVVYPLPAPTVPAPTLEEVITSVATEIVLDAVDQLLRDVIQTYPVERSKPLCSVVNSNDKLLGTVSKDLLVDAGKNFAQRQNSCVVTNVKGVARTRTLISSSGRILGKGLTEKETVALKKRNGYDSCRVMTCELR